jgi:hypothetical protein
MQGRWVERAKQDFGVPEAYFRLWPFRGMSEEERYREIATLYQLGTYSSVRLVNGDTIEGVYESYAGLMEALKRNDVVMVEYFWSRLKPHQKEYLKEHSPGTDGNFTAVDFLYSLLGYPVEVDLNKRGPYEMGEYIVAQGLPVPDNLSTEVIFYMAERNYLPALEKLEEEFGYTREFLETVIISGNVAFLDRILPHYFDLPEGETVSEIPILPFDPERKVFPLYDIFSPDREKIAKLAYSLLASAVRSCNVQIVDFFRSLCGVDVLPERSILYLTRVHRRPVDAFSILQRTNIDRVDFRYYSIWDYGDINLILYILLRSNLTLPGNNLTLPENNLQESLERIIASNLGNIPLLVTMLELYPQYQQTSELDMYPLSRSILEN